CFYLTHSTGRLPIDESRLKPFVDAMEVLRALDQHKINLHDPIRVRLQFGREIVREEEQPATPRSQLVTTTAGRVVFNDILPAKMPFYDRAMTNTALDRVVGDCHTRLGRRATVELLDRLKTLGFRHATLSGLSLGVGDLRPPARKDEVLRATEAAVEK